MKKSVATLPVALLPIFIVGFFSILMALPCSAALKYGPGTSPLSAQTNQEYFRKNPAPDFWSLIPYYTPQTTNRGCSAANLSMILNAARAGTVLNADDQLVSVETLIEKYTNPEYRGAILGKSVTIGTNFANSNLARLLTSASEKLKVATPATKVDFVIIDQKDLKKSRGQFLKALIQNEKSAKDFIFFSFVQGKVTGDPEGGAHVGTVGAFDAKKKLVLVLDPDRQWYEPYWTSVDQLFEAISDPKSDSEEKAGWLHFIVR